MKGNFISNYGLMVGLNSIFIASMFIVPIVRDYFEQIMIEQWITIQFFTGFIFLIIGIIISTISIIAEKRGTRE